eukprot:12379475-Karenia_brevis.AAC.1
MSKHSLRKDVSSKESSKGLNSDPGDQDGNSQSICISISRTQSGRVFVEDTSLVEEKLMCHT